MYVYDSILYDIENVTLLKLEHKFFPIIISTAETTGWLKV